MNKIYDTVLNMNSLNSKPKADGTFALLILPDMMELFKRE